MTYGNPLIDFSSYTGDPNSLVGTQNPAIDGGAIANIQDWGKLLLMYLRDGVCGDTQVVSPESLAFQRINRGAGLILRSSAVGNQNAGMGWWINLPEEEGESTIYYAAGGYGAVAWIDLERGIGGYAMTDNYGFGGSFVFTAFNHFLQTVVPLHQKLVDEARQTAARRFED